ncbi:MAG: 4-hydroxy-tetrahydrodipicolinate reductase [Bacteroidota bacterium]|nr:4-hydroxy-tetrahydrodipicolinate reductase [Bacteroidota bacterium]MDP4232328.1 4-hydroxy-tetrahydrodipicolinate reductase [Bacteroidota bacterium]MDP4241467.1 4-hydroxy-tetrahydrodipicolinate reductase [Bacteroidota bacterium]MDP4286709.1 4-hydroxy-tetrahydrodipicolinate reductase [Bacteroidota bacterium]
MRIALLGFGKMGHEVEAAATAAGHEIVARFDIDRPISVDAMRKSGAQVAIDFSQPDAVEHNAKLVGEAHVSLVIGTTGWEGSREVVQGYIENAGIGCITGSNFSIGVNLFLEIVRNASTLLDEAGYDAYIFEAHHRAKKDFPSGTALRLSEAVLAGMKSKSRAVSELPIGNAIAKDLLQISSLRAGAIPGTHTVGFESTDDSIELTHRARSRRGFASGAIRAAEWIVSRKGFYRFEEHVADILEGK